MAPMATQAAHVAYIGLGANLGDAPAALRAALQALAALPGTRLQQCSALYRSAPVDATGPDFYNAVAALHTSLPPHELLAALQSIEAAAGRERPYRNAPRTLDLDILLFDGFAIDTPTLTVPHPRMHERAFVLLPLAEIAPAEVRDEWLQAVRDQRIERLETV
ncbi:2-amino-4-hydroxy-6-hydroxymethyldihydropteridine diphosphokinase [Acidovorax sp. DW039]|uniref:2-amino-4-hydroxy-6- hydroxymethyldihydropteridine diphosphokinase n=1 Tax=Acidovorax sp. DW039 TaxID=3095606 RepID=UPI0030D48187